MWVRTEIPISQILFLWTEPQLLKAILVPSMSMWWFECVEIEIEANSPQLELRIGLSMAEAILLGNTELVWQVLTVGDPCTNKEVSPAGL